MTITLKHQLDNFFFDGKIFNEKGQHDDCYNFYDWFCKDSSLPKKAERLFKQVRTFLKYHPEIDQTKTYVFFKNNCPMNGSLYDDFRICDRETGDVIYTVTPRSGFSIDRGRAILYGKANGFDGPLATGTFKEICKYQPI